MRIISGTLKGKSINFLKNNVAVNWIKVSSFPFLLVFASLSLSLMTNENDLIYPDSLNGFLGIGLSEYIFSMISTNLLFLLSSFLFIIELIL